MGWPHWSAALLLLAACGEPPPPDEGRVADRFVGAARCAECHERRHTAWSRDWHARALTRAAPATVAGRMPAHFRGASSEAWMRRDGGAFVMRTAGGDGVVTDFPIQWLLGGRRMQDPITVLADGRWQVLPVYWHATGGAWVDFTEESQGTLDPSHPFFWTNWRRNATHECLDCHTTGLDVRYDRAAGTWATSMVDPGVACESCHGPGARHAATRSREDIVHPGRLPPGVGLAICGQCHGTRTPLFPILDTARRFQPGDAYDEHYQAVVVTAGTARSKDFFADGRPRTSSHEYTALLQSRCHRVGDATCLTCHAPPHEPSAGHALRDPDPDASCRACHAGIAAAGRDHTRHEAPAAQQCVACHMPAVVRGVRDEFADHALDVPVPENTLRHGVPNACNVCHVDATPAAMADALHARWPHASARQGRRLRLADAFDEGTSAGSLAPLRAVTADADEAPTLRGAAAQLLAQRFPRDAPPTLLPLLTEASIALRAQAIEALGMSGARETATRLIPLLEDASLQVRHVTALVLASFGDARGYVALRALADDPHATALVQPHLLLGMEALHRNDLATGTAELERAADLMPYHAGALVLLADAYARQGRGVLARERLAQALSFDRTHAGARQRLAAMTTRR